MEIEGYRKCAKCGQPVLDYVAWQTGGVCFDPCFVNGDLARFREVELIQRATVVKVKRPPSTSKKKNHAKPHAKSDYISHLARERALRRLPYLFPDVFALLLTEERHKAGMGPKPTRVKDALKTAVDDYAAFVAYHHANKE